ncbi:MAG: SDR family oxidoreductase [Nitrososphaerota archaeon]|jgi:UDP-glucuronate decarboxylase|uniref:UDP-glucuronic acid decarboxylase family protein n=1 Tax=Candidatus Bathycorpusculum sp. TaxID=2994959 RepID=UPI00282A2882|nr:SDR family oxidoreductase [Candidatus Termitimicrobium sp.]MCL2430967.1 SDR family oxidoreductase [Candidatus Termitimicrobium sp.]MDR0493675.1 SDR family oxidoreductase [Nitrososphaerota archaeon]
MDDIIRKDLEDIKEIVKGDIFTNKKVLVTGGAGFIGSWICDCIIDFGAQVTVVDDLSTGKIKNIEQRIKQVQVRFVQADICTFKSDEKFDFIIHLAGHASPDEYQAHPIETLQTSAVGTFIMAELARKNDAPILFSSTSETYGDTEIIPTPETYWGNVNPIGPRSCYDEGKRFAEAMLMAYRKQYGLDVRVPRIFNSYGPRLREDGLYGRALSRFINQALTKQNITVYGDGKQTRSFCYISDTVTGLLLLATKAEAIGEVVNVGNTQEVTILELAQKIKEITKTESDIVFYPLPKDDPKRRCPDTTKLEKIVAWKPKIELDEGLKKTIKWFAE